MTVTQQTRHRGRHTPPQQRTPEQLLPHNTEAEESLLGAMLLSRAAIDAANHLGADDYYSVTHGHIHHAITTLHRDGNPVDPVTVADHLRRSGLLDACGGSAELIALQAGAPSTTNAAHYARLVTEHAQLRRLISVCAELTTAAYSAPADGAHSLVTRAANELEQLSAGTSRIDRSPAAQIKAHTLSLAELDTLPPQQWLLPGLIPEVGLGIMWGRSQAYKSFLAVDLAMRISAGIDAWGEPTEQRRVLYVAGEGSGGIGKRFRAWRIRNGTTREQHLIDTLTMAPPMADEDQVWATELARQAVRLGSQFVVIDTVARAFGGGSENDTADMNRFVGACDRVWQWTGGVVMGVHHSGHDKTRMRGNSALFGACEFVLAVDRPNEHYATVSNRDEDAGKSKDDQAMAEALAFRLDIVETGQTDRSGRPVTSLVPRLIDPEDLPEPERKPSGTQRTSDADRLLDVARGLRILNGTIESIASLASALGCSWAVADKAIKAGVTLGKLRQEGRAYHPTTTFTWKAEP